MNVPAKKIWVRDFEVGRLVVFEACIWGMCAGMMAAFQGNAHPAIALLAGLFAIMVYFAIWQTRYGFALCCVFSIALWGGVAGQLAFHLSEGDLIWASVAALLAGLLAFGSHIGKRELEKNVELVN